MRKPLPIQLTIPSPCSEKWDAMTPDAQGRFCAHCQKSVIDFTGWNDKTLYEFFSKNNTPVCGRLQNDQLNRTIHIPPQPHSKLYRIAIALGLTILAAQAHDAQARVQPLLTEQNILTAAQSNDSTGADSIVIKGKVLDEHKEPFFGAIVQLEEIKGRVISGAITDTNGNFVITITDSIYTSLKKSGAQLRAFFTGYAIKLSHINLNQPLLQKPILIEMKPGKLMGLIQVTITVPSTPPLIDPKNPNVKTFRSRDLHNMGY